MADRGGGLVLRRGRAERELPALAAELGAEEVHHSADVSPFARRRAEAVTRALRERGVELTAHPGVAVVDDPAELRTQAGGPYTVFSPFHRTWLEAPRRDVLGAPRKLPALPAGLAKGRLPSLASLGLEQLVEEPPRGGERAGRERLSRFLEDDVRAYADNHDALDRDRTSRLSPYLHLGCVSAREVEERLPGGAGADAFRRQLCWRDFHHQVLHALPAQRGVRVPGALPRQHLLEPCARALRRLVRGPHRLPARGRRDAPAAPGGLDAQPRAARGRIVPHQGPGHRLALGRALVHASAGGRRRGQQQRQLAVDRLGGHRSAAGVSPDLQPGAPDGAPRPGGPLRAPVRARAARRAGRASGRAVADARGRAAGGRVRGGRGLPGADRGPRRGAPRGAGALPGLVP